MTSCSREMESKRINQDKIDMKVLMRQMTQLITETKTLYSTLNLQQNDLRTSIQAVLRQQRRLQEMFPFE